MGDEIGDKQSGWKTRMKLKTFEGKIPSMRAVKCPACSETYYTAGLKVHILSQARKEALLIFMSEAGGTTSLEAICHAVFVKENRTRVLVVEKERLNIEFD